MDEVPEDVLKYLPVIARTQNENTQNYPVSWTHVFLDTKVSSTHRRMGRPFMFIILTLYLANYFKQKDKGKQEGDADLPETENDHPEYGNLSEPFIMTSVTTPVYRKVNRNLPVRYRIANRYEIGTFVIFLNSSVLPLLSSLHYTLMLNSNLLIRLIAWKRRNDRSCRHRCSCCGF